MNYLFTDASGNTNDSGVGFTGNGLSINFTLTGADSYSVSITPGGGSATVLTGTLAGTPGTGIADARFFNFNAGAGGNADFFVNNLAVIPEPSTYALLAGPALLGAFMYVRRRRS